MKIDLPEGHTRLPVAPTSGAALFAPLADMQRAIISARLRLNDGGIGYCVNAGRFRVTHTTRDASEWRTRDLSPALCFADAVKFVNNLENEA